MPLALLMSAPEAPGKFAWLLNMALAGSLVSTPKLMVGTNVCWLNVSVIQENWPPKLRPCAPRVQFNVSLMVRYKGLRRLGAAVAVAPSMPAAAAIPTELLPGAPPRLKPI